MPTSGAGGRRLDQPVKHGPDGKARLGRSICDEAMSERITAKLPLICAARHYAKRLARYAICFGLKERVIAVPRTITRSTKGIKYFSMASAIC